MFSRIIALSCLLCLHFVPSAFAKEPVGEIKPVELHAKNGGRIWVYLPNTPADSNKLACVVVPPAGSRLFHGMSLVDGDRLEHLPYVSAGFAVISFDISGPLTAEEKTDAAVGNAIKTFLNAKCGVTDALEALELTLSKYPQIDPNQIFVAGHSSAGTLALQIAAASDKFKGCVSFAPITNLEDRFGPRILRALEQIAPGSTAKLIAASPIKNIDALNCPIFLFHATDDGNVSPASVIAYKEALLQHHKSVVYSVVGTGGHFESMIDPGIPRAITWLKSLDQKKSN